MRVFTAVDVQDQETLEELARVRDRLDLGFKPVDAEKMHITLQFFGDVSEEGIGEIKRGMKTDLEPFELEIKGVGVFPSRDYIRVVWAGAGDEKMQKLYQDVSDHGVSDDNDHDFKPHVTMMRVENVSPGQKKKLRKSLEEFEDHSFGCITVGSVRLFESRRTRKGSRYKLLHEEEL